MNSKKGNTVWAKDKVFEIYRRHRYASLKSTDTLDILRFCQGGKIMWIIFLVAIGVGAYLLWHNPKLRDNLMT
jgi:hypothetical protein